MSGTRIARRSVAYELSRLLDSPELANLIAELEALRWTGRKGYPIRALVGACLAKSLYAIPTWSRTAALIAEHAALRDALGAAPSVYALYRFSTKLRQHKPLLAACLDRVTASIRAELPESVGTSRSMARTCPPPGADFKRKLTKWRCPTGECQPKSIWRKASRLHPLIPRESKRWRDLYRGRAAIEKEFGTLKHRFGLAPLRVRGLERVALHADLTMLARLSQALARARAVPLAA